jgi:hypothetical protein
MMIGGAKIVIRSCNFYKNSAIASTALGAGASRNVQGGAMFLNQAKLVDISASNITYNRVLAPTSLVTTTSLLYPNGGAIMVFHSVVRINASTVAYNRVESTGPPLRGNSDGIGGAVYYSGASTLVFKASSFYGNGVVTNYTASGGAIGGVGLDVTMVGCSVYGNFVSGQSLSGDDER